MSDQPESWEDIQRRGAEALAADGEPPLDKSKGSTFDRASTDRGGPVGPGMPVAGSGVEDMRPPVGPTEMFYADREDVRSAADVLTAAQDSSLVLPSGATVTELTMPYLEVPHWPRSGREAGAWAAGCAQVLMGDDATMILVRIKPEHVDGAGGALLDAGFRVERYSSMSEGDAESNPPCGWRGASVTLQITRTEP